MDVYLSEARKQKPGVDSQLAHRLVLSMLTTVVNTMEKQCQPRTHPMFASSGPKRAVILQERNLVALPLNKGHRTADQVLTLQVLRRFEFEAPLMRSGVIAVDTNNPDTGLLFVRGAPSTVEQLIRGGQIPADFRQVDHTSSSGQIPADFRQVTIHLVQARFLLTLDR